MIDTAIYHCTFRTKTDAFEILRQARNAEHRTINFLMPDRTLEQAEAYMQAMRMCVSRLRQTRRDQNKEVINFRMRVLGMTQTNDGVAVKFKLDIDEIPQDIKQAFNDLETTE